MSDQAGWAARASGGQAVRAFAASFWAGEVLVDSGTVGMGPSCLVAASRTAAGFQPVRSISADRPARLARCCRPPGIADRLRASRLKKWRTATRPLPGPDPRGHRAPCGQGPLQRVDGPGDGPASGHGAHVAVLVRRARHARAGRPQAHRSPAVVHRAAGRAGQDAGVSASRRNRVPLSQVVVSRGWHAGPCSEASPRRCPPPPCAAGCTRTRSSPGSTAAGSSSLTQLPAQGCTRPRPVLPHLARPGPGESEYVISADEKASIQARCRCHLSQMRWPPRGRGRK